MVDERKVPDGYKITEIGIIPEDWDFVRIGDLGNFSKGAGIRKDQANSGHIPCIRYGELYTKHNDIIRNYYSFISRDIAETSRKLKAGDVLFAGSGETKEEIGKCAAFIDETEVYAGGDIIIFSPVKGISEFYGYLLNAPFSIKQKASKGQGDAIVHISSSNLADIVIPFPNEIEQKSIAEALSDTDNLILSLEKLIDKKKKIKQGAMQKLLTGKKRLPGFSGEWNEYKITDIAIVGRGRVISHREINNSIEKLYPVYSSQTSNEGIMGYIDSYDFEGDYITWTTDGVNAGKVFYRSGKFNCTNVCGTIKLKQFNHEFVSMALDNATDKYVSKNLANPKLMNDVMKNIEIALPSIEEQKAIAQILSDMNAEIEALEEKLEKYKTIKQGMMQELLTGRIRLI